MEAREPLSFNELVDVHATRLGFNDYKLSLAIGLLPGNVGYSATQVGRLRKGKAKPTASLVARLVQVFDLADGEADRLWFAAGLIPEGWDFDTFQQAAAAQRDRRPRHERSRRREDRELPPPNPGQLRPVGRAA